MLDLAAQLYNTKTASYSPRSAYPKLDNLGGVEDKSSCPLNVRYWERLQCPLLALLGRSVTSSKLQLRPLGSLHDDFRPTIAPGLAARLWTLTNQRAIPPDALTARRRAAAGRAPDRPDRRAVT